MILILFIFLLLIILCFYSLHQKEFFFQKCVKKDEKCITYDIGSEEEKNNCCSGYCVRKDNNFQYKVCSDKPEYICGIHDQPKKINLTTTPRPVTPNNSLLGRKKRFCGATFLDWNLFYPVKDKKKEVEEEDNEEEDNLYNPFENIHTNSCGILELSSSKKSYPLRSNKKKSFFCGL
jgi:hypothetical protein